MPTVLEAEPDVLTSDRHYGALSVPRLFRSALKPLAISTRFTPQMSSGPRPCQRDVAGGG